MIQAYMKIYIWKTYVSYLHQGWLCRDLERHQVPLFQAAFENDPGYLALCLARFLLSYKTMIQSTHTAINSQDCKQFTRMILFKFCFILLASFWNTQWFEATDTTWSQWLEITASDQEWFCLSFSGHACFVLRYKGFDTIRDSNWGDCRSKDEEIYDQRLWQ